VKASFQCEIHRRRSAHSRHSRRGARRASSDLSRQPRRLCHDPPCILRGRRPDGRGAPGSERKSGGLNAPDAIAASNLMQPRSLALLVKQEIP